MKRLVVLLMLLVLRNAATEYDGVCKSNWPLTPRPHSVSVSEFGAVGDGKTLNTVAFQNAIFYLKSFVDKGGAQLYVPAGQWLTGCITLTSHLTLFLEKDAVILGSQDYSHWDVVDPLPSYGRGLDLPGRRYRSLITGQNLTGIVITVEKESKPSVYSEVEHWYEATLQTLHSNTNVNTQNKTLHHVYKTVVNGFSAVLTPHQATQIANKPWVMAVIPDRIHQLQTTRSPSFLGLYTDDNNNKVPGRLLSISDSGSNDIIGFIDTGIWPEHRSFSDEGLGPFPSKWKGKCVGGQNFTNALCNKKIIGARFFTKGYEHEYGKINPSEDFRSARDSDGHGTHTASTAAGRAVANASLFGYAKGTAFGVAPKARIAVYKACWKNGCTDSDILSAFDKAVEDGVDIISYSIGGKSTNLDIAAIGAFGAMERGVFVSVSAGNSGPKESSLGNVAPWMTVVGASTIDRRFPGDLVLGDGRVLKGSSLYSGKPLPKKIPIKYEGSCDSIEEEEVRGKMVVCFGYGDVYPQEAAVKSAGGAAMVVVLDSGVAALLKGAHPDWTPTMIRSAMMTTAYTKDNRGHSVLDGNDYTKATVWATGAGHVDPEKAVDPGLVYDISSNDYLNYLCASKYSIEGIRSLSNKSSCNKSQSVPWNLNYPAITVDFNAYGKTVIVVRRTVTHVSETPGTYAVKVVNPKGVDVRVTPVEMKFKDKGEKQSYSVLIKACKLTVAPGESATDVGEIVWSDGQRNVVSPVVMLWKKDY